MLSLHVVQAEYGDCFIVEFGSPSHPRYILIDGGPRTIYEQHLRSTLHTIGTSGGHLDAAILSHVDTDHVTGLLDLIADLRDQHARGEPEIIKIDALWHNAFSDTIGRDSPIETRLKTLVTSSVDSMALTTMAVMGIQQGHQLRLAATAHGVPINPSFASGHIIADETSEKVFDNLALRIVGPTAANLEELKEEWLEWLDEYEDRVSKDPSVAAMADQSIPNLSSIMVLAEADEKTILLTGDGRGDHLLQGLAQAHLLNSKGTIHVDILKVPHHGSDRNVTRKFFKTVTANTYVISANGRHGNPDLATLIWMVEAAQEQKRSITIVTTNATPSTQKLVQEYPPSEYKYHLTEMGKAHTMQLTLS
jgi:ribonuclease BN (tRNA processing enzyme)